MKAITSTEYLTLEESYDFFNDLLFDSSLPACLITLRAKRSLGYFSGDRFVKREGERTTDEIALNAESFVGRTDKDILSTLVHEMVHLWQHHCGSPGRGRYHNKEWASYMEAIGMMPSDTGQPGGKRTGQSMSHYVIKGGRFDTACDELLGGGLKLHWNSMSLNGQVPKKNKVKYTCGVCGLNAWAKPDASLLCGVCLVVMPPVL